MKRISKTHDTNENNDEIASLHVSCLVPGAKIGEKSIKTPVKPLKTI